MASVLLLLLATVCSADAEAIPYPAALDQRPGPAEASVAGEGHDLVLRNGVLEAHWKLKDGRLIPGHVLSRSTSVKLELPRDAFIIKGSNLEVHSSTLDLLSQGESSDASFHLVRLEPTNASQLADSLAGWRAELNLRDPSTGFEVLWSVELRDGAGYVRQIVEIVPRSAAIDLEELILFKGLLPLGKKAGGVQGVPVISDEFFLGYEHPQSENAIDGGVACCKLMQKRRLEPGSSFRGTLGVGVAPAGQIRRAFWHYLERERAHPTRPMLHYNSWYDIGTGTPFNAADAVTRLDQIASELSRRGVKLDAFLLDDGWDDPDSGPWDVHSGFSNSSLQKLEGRAAHWSTGLGVWFSPFGGYHEPRQRRLSAARSADIPVREETRQRVKAVLKSKGACSKTSPCGEGEGDCDSNEDCAGNLECFVTQKETNPPGVDRSELTGDSADFCFDPGVQSGYLGLGIPSYYRHLRKHLVRWLDGGARMFKLDGIGNPAGHEQTLAEDFDSAVGLIAELRRISRSVFINLSTGTWPSPFWLLSSDTVWRRGHDHYFAGEGPARERWITYRDAKVFEMVVKQSPLFPLNSLMVHGVIFAKDAWDLNKPEGSGDGMSELPFRHEVRSAFGSGTMLQELYLTPSLLSQENWDDLAAAASWSRARIQTLADAHWVGGDPEKGEVYGWAAWQDAAKADGSASAVLTLRNPTSTVQTITLDAASVFELPSHALSRGLELNSPFSDQRPRFVHMRPGRSVSVRLKPFSVAVFDTEAPEQIRPEWEWIDDWLDPIRANIMPILWLIGAMVAGTYWWRNSTSSGPVPPPVPVEELRRRRLAALGQTAN